VLLVEGNCRHGFTARYLRKHCPAGGQFLAHLYPAGPHPERIAQVPVEFRCFEIPIAL
jgi:hypothetical protein